MPTYYGEAAGARVIRMNTGLTQLGTPYELSLETWDCIPGGESGDVVFRSADITLWASNGYTLDVTPCIDGVLLPVQSFSGSGAGTVVIQAPISQRGTRMSVKLATRNRAGEIEIQNVTWTGGVIRRTP